MTTDTPGRVGFPRVLLWDLDGTLTYWKDMSVIVRVSWLYLSLRPPGIGRLRALLTSLRAYLRMMKNAGPETNDRLYNRLVSAGWALAEDEAHEVTRRMLASPALDEIIRACIRLIPEARDLVAVAARQGRPQYVATNPVMPSEFNRRRLTIAGYDTSLFRYVSGSEDFAGQKRSVDFYHRLLALSGLGPDECVMIGNDPRKDLVAKRAGIRTFLLRTVHTVSAPWPESCEPDWSGGYRELGALLGPAPDASRVSC